MSPNHTTANQERVETTTAPSVTSQSFSRRRTVIATMSGTTATTVIVSIQALVLAPLFLNRIGASLYGAWLATGELLVWLQAFDLGLPNLLIQRIGAAHGRQDATTVGEYLATGLAVLGSIALAVAAAAVAVAPFVPAMFGLSGSDGRELASALALAGAATALTLAVNAVVGFARGIQRTVFISIVLPVSVLTGFAVTFALLVSGWGLWSAAVGVAARACVLVAGAAIFVVFHLRRGLSRHFRVRGHIWREVLSISPVTALGGLAYAGMNQSETTLVAVLGRPDVAAAYALTRRAADLARALIDMIGAAAYGGFAHLVASPERERSLEVHSEITSLRMSLAVAAAGAYIAVNSSLVGAWVGSSLYLGFPLTVAFALQMLVVGHAYLLNYLYRATGPVATGSWLLLAEAAFRIPLMAVLFHLAGVIGLPAGGIVTGVAFGATALWLTRRKLAAICPSRPATFRGLTLVRVAVFAAGCAVGGALYHPRWDWVVTIAVTFAALATGALALADPWLGMTVGLVRSRFKSVRFNWR